MADKKKLIVRAHKATEADFSQEKCKCPEDEKIYKRCCAAIQNGFPWHAVIVDADSGDVVYVCLVFCKSEYSALRKGERYKKRYERHGDFNKPLGFTKPASVNMG